MPASQPQGRQLAGWSIGPLRGSIHRAMTINITNTRRRPVSHAFVVPVVRELSPPKPGATDATW
jgi:hypothetical protein